MSKILGGLVLCALVTVGIGNAVPVLAPPSPACLSLGSGNPTDITIQFAVWSAVNFNCETSDKIYSNFAITGLPTDTSLNLQEQVLGPLDVHVVTFNSNFTGAFTVSYDIAVDLTLNGGAERIVRVSGDLSNPSNLGNPANTKQVFLESGVLVGSLTSTAGAPGVPINIAPGVTALHVIDTYSAAGGAAVSVSNTFVEAAVPEPVALSLVGSGLLLLAKLKRRKV